MFVALGFVVHRHDLERGTACPRRNMSSEGGAWRVHGTKKGALPIAVEKRPCGKKVTLIANVTNPGALLHELKGRYEKECMG